MRRTETQWEHLVADGAVLVIPPQFIQHYLST